MINNKEAFAIVTGASLGLGRSFAIELARRGHNLILVSQKNEGLIDLGNKIKEDYKISVQCFEADLTNLDELTQLIENVKDNYQLNILVNNAGIGCATQFDETSLAFVDKMLKINIRALVLLTHQFLPLLKKQEEAYILNVGSMSAFSPMGYKSVYPASKRFVYNFSLGLSEELKGTGVYVSVINPGPMRTNEFITRRITKHGPMVKASVVHTDKIAHITLKKMFRRKRVIVVGRTNKLMRILMAIVPTSIATKIVTNANKNEVLNTFTKTETSLS